MELLDELKQTISAHLDLCEAKDTPFICQNISTPDGKAKIIDDIVELVVRQDYSIGQAVIELEREFNPQLPD